MRKFSICISLFIIMIGGFLYIKNEGAVLKQERQTVIGEINENTTSDVKLPFLKNGNIRVVIHDESSIEFDGSYEVSERGDIKGEVSDGKKRIPYKFAFQDGVGICDMDVSHPGSWVMTEVATTWHFLFSTRGYLCKINYAPGKFGDREFPYTIMDRRRIDGTVVVYRVWRESDDVPFESYDLLVYGSEWSARVLSRNTGSRRIEHCFRYASDPSLLTIPLLRPIGVRDLPNGNDNVARISSVLATETAEPQPAIALSVLADRTADETARNIAADHLRSIEDQRQPLVKTLRAVVDDTSESMLWRSYAVQHLGQLSEPDANSAYGPPAYVDRAREALEYCAASSEPDIVVPALMQMARLRTAYPGWWELADGDAACARALALPSLNGGYVEPVPRPTSL
jgi:hypothetical protein